MLASSPFVKKRTVRRQCLFFISFFKVTQQKTNTNKVKRNPSNTPTYIISWLYETHSEPSLFATGAAIRMKKAIAGIWSSEERLLWAWQSQPNNCILNIVSMRIPCFSQLLPSVTWPVLPVNSVLRKYSRSFIPPFSGMSNGIHAVMFTSAALQKLYMGIFEYNIV